MRHFNVHHHRNGFAYGALLLSLGLTACGGPEQDLSVDVQEEEVRGGTNSATRPWMVSLQFRGQSGWSHFCGGTLVRNRSVMTAAHCIEAVEDANLPLRDLRACVGARDISTQCTSGRTSGIVRMDAHPAYATNASGIFNDIGVVRLTKSFANRTKITLANQNQLPGHNTNVVLRGWGRTDTGNLSNVLQRLRYASVGNTQCRNRWAGAASIRNSHICTRADADQGACNGDSGGVLEFDGRQVGVVSFGVNGCTGSRPDVYTNVASFRGWVLGCADNPSSCR